MTEVKLPAPAIETTAFSRDSSTQYCYTEAQLKQYGNDRAREALEKVALMLESLHKNDQTNILYGVKAIRALAKEIK